MQKSYRDLTLIDLHSQRRAVQKFVQNLTPAEIIDWMKCYGKVTVSDNRPIPLYAFESRQGYRTLFEFEDDKLIIFDGRWA